EAPRPHRLDHVVAQHQVADVGTRQDDALVAGEPARAADAEETLDLVSHPADGLHLAVLVYRPGDGERLLEGNRRETREQHEELGGRGAVAIYLAVQLLEAEAGGQAERELLGVAPAQEAAQDQHALAVQRATQLHLALDIENAVDARGGACANARRLAEGKVV